MIRTSSALFWFSLVIIASVGLYRTSDRVQELNRQLSSINTSIEAEQQSIHVLKAEWVYLANPERVKALAQKHLALHATTPQQIGTLSNLADMLPTHHEALAMATETAKPVANLHSTLAALPPTQHIATLRAKTTTVRVASSDTGHITDHMTIRRTASAQEASLDPIGSLIGQLDKHP